MNLTNRKNIKEFLETPEIKSIRDSNEFYFQKGQDKFNEWLDLNVSKDNKNRLFELSKNYQLFTELSRQDDELSPIVDLIFSIIAYMDYSARDKSLYNEYQPNRSIAKAFVRMNFWVDHLLKIKFYPEKVKAGNTLNAFNYMLSPTKEFNILSNNHRSLISKNILQKPYNQETFSDELIDYFKYIEAEVKDKRNTTHLVTSILYKYKSLWLEPLTIEDDIKIIFDFTNNNTEKERYILARIGQGKFRTELIKIWNGCSISGYSDTSLLVASHIKPWRLSNNTEKLDPYNGFLLLPNYDKLFDQGLISFDDAGDILISVKLQDYYKWGINTDLKIKLKEKNKVYLKYHRDNVFVGGNII